MAARARITLTPDGAAEPLPAVSARVDRGLAWPVGRAEFVLPKAVEAPAPGTRAEVSVQQGEDEFVVLTGQVARVTSDRGESHVTILEALYLLNELRVTKAYSNSTTGDVIADLCADAGVDTGAILPGNFLTNIVLRAEATALAHAMRLAGISGMALVSGTDGTLGTANLSIPVPEGAVQADRAATALRQMQATLGESAARVIGEGMTGARGPQAANLPVTDTALIEAGNADAGHVTKSAAIKSLAEVTNLQLARDQRLSARSGGLELVTPMPEDLALGAVVAITEGAIPVPRMGRVERIALAMVPLGGVQATYGFSDLEVA